MRISPHFGLIGLLIFSIYLDQTYPNIYVSFSRGYFFDQGCGTRSLSLPPYGVRDPNFSHTIVMTSPYELM